MSQQMERLQALIAAFSAALTAKQVAEIIITQGIDALGADAGAVLLLDPDGQTLRVIAAISYAESLLDEFATMPLDLESPATDAVRLNTPIWLENPDQFQQQYPAFFRNSFSTFTQTSGSVPLSLDHHAIGCLAFSFTAQRVVSAEERAFANSLAYHAAQAIDRAQLYENAQRDKEALQTRYRQQALIAQLSQQALHAKLDILLATAVDTVADTLDVPLCGIFELSPDQQRLSVRAGVGWQNHVVGHSAIQASRESGWQTLLNQDTPITIAEAPPDVRVTPLLIEHNVASGITVVVFGHNQPVGLLGVYTTNERSFTEDEIVFVQAVANILAAAIARHQSEEEHLLLERQLLQAQKLESLGVLAGGIAHDFNNLLVVILGNASLALMELAPESPARGSLMEIEQTARRAADLTSQMLAYAGKGKFAVSVINLAVLVEEMSHLLQASVSKSAVLRYNLARDLPAVKVDATQIRQILMNLVVNASEAIGEKNGIITISAGAIWVDQAYLSNTQSAPGLPEGTYVYFEVSDTGQGMTAETRARIFEPFFTTKYTGRGLGLAAVLGIMRRHKGALRVYSEPGQGTTFKVLLPAVKVQTEEAAQETQLSQVWQGNGTVLIVDDETDVRTLVARMLERSGFSVLTAPDGRTALQVFRANADAIVCVLLDMTMPHMGGEETFRELRRIQPRVRVILMSGYTEEEITSRFAGKGLAGFLHKPFTPQRLRAKLQAVLE